MLINARVLSDVFKFSPDGIIICDKHGDILSANNSVFPIFGYTPDELYSKNIEILIPDSIKSKHNSYLENYVKNPIPRQMSTNMRLKGKKKDGTNIFLSISLINSISKTNDLIIIVTVRDVSDYVKKSDDLEKVSYQLKDALKLSKLGHWELDLVKNELEWSEEVFDIFELSRESFKPTYEGFIELVYSEDREFLQRSFEDSIYNQIPYNIVHRYETPTGHLKFLRERGSNFYDNTGKIVKTIGTVQDVTEVQKQKILLNDYITKLENKNKELEEFTNITAHDLQEPLTNIIGLIQLLKNEWNEEFSDKKELENYLDYIEKGTDRMSKLIKALMETSRLGRLSIFDDIDCNQVIEEIKESMFVQLRKYNAKIISRKLPKIKGLPFEFSLLFQNLISNALKYSRKGVDPIIRISSHDQGPSWLFTVEDNGIGIEHENKDKLFKMFRRLHKQTEIEGTGIGLVQCKKIVELHHGEIWFESQPGNGTIFFFTVRK